MVRLDKMYVIFIIAVFSIYLKDTEARMKCQNHLHNSQHIIAMDPPSLTDSNWSSDRCETRANGVYVIRNYWFKKRIAKLLTYHFSDPDCTTPVHSVLIKGTYSLDLGDGHPLVIGSTKGQFEATGLTCVVYDLQESPLTSVLARTLNISGDAKPEQHKAYRLGVAQFYPLSKELGLELYEIQLVRLLLTRNRKSDSVRKTLLLGNTGEDASIEVPIATRYTYPLQDINQAKSGCDVCMAVSASNQLHPPRFEVGQHQSNLDSAKLLELLQGKWNSEGCEVFENGKFVTRLMTFSHSKWTELRHYYQDPYCQRLAATLHRHGVIARLSTHPTGNSSIVSFDVDMMVKSQTLKAVSPRLLTQLNLECKTSGHWSKGVHKTPSSNCYYITDLVPARHSLKDLFTLVDGKKRLTTGDRESERHGSRPQRSRPQSLFKCLGRGAGNALDGSSTYYAGLDVQHSRSRRYHAYNGDANPTYRVDHAALGGVQQSGTDGTGHHTWVISLAVVLLTLAFAT